MRSMSSGTVVPDIDSAALQNAHELPTAESPSARSTKNRRASRVEALQTSLYPAVLVPLQQVEVDYLLAAGDETHVERLLPDGPYRAEREFEGLTCDEEGGMDLPGHMGRGRAEPGEALVASGGTITQLRGLPPWGRTPNCS